MCPYVAAIRARRRFVPAVGASGPFDLGALRAWFAEESHRAACPECEESVMGYEPPFPVGSKVKRSQAFRDDGFLRGVAPEVLETWRNEIGEVTGRDRGVVAVCWPSHPPGQAFSYAPRDLVAVPEERATEIVAPAEGD